MDEIVVGKRWFTNVECDNSTWQNKVNKLNDLYLDNLSVTERNEIILFLRDLPWKKAMQVR